MKRIAVLLVALATLTLTPVAAHAEPECYEVERLPGECLTLATYTYITDLQGYRDHLIGQVLAERADRQAAQLEANTLQQELWDVQAEVGVLNKRNAVLKAKLAWKQQLIRRLWHTIERLS